MSAAPAPRMYDSMQQFRDAIQSVGLTPPDVIEPGKIHRFPGIDKRNGNTAGWCKLFADGMGGVFGDWSSDFYETWQAHRDKPISTADRQAFRRYVETAKAEAEAERQAKQAEAAKKAGELWDAAQPEIGVHRYLITKGVKAYGIRTNGERLLIPLRDASGALHSLQFIPPNGKDKRFLPDGMTSGCYFGIGKPDGVLCIAEGYATAASIHEATGHAVAVAFNAGNLEPVAKALREKFLDLQLILCADDDYRTEGNPGITKATEAARAVDGLLAIPDFGTDRPEGATDFNDLHQAQGLDVVRQCIEMATMTEPNSKTETISGTDDEIIAHLANLSAMEYERIRDTEAARLGIRKGTLDKIVHAARRGDVATGLEFDDIEPWEHQIEPGQLLTDIVIAVQRFIVCQPETARTVALWVAMTWFMDVVQIAPLAVITAPEKRCGKSLLLFLLGRLVRRPLTASNISPAALFRSIDAWEPTLLVDEADAFMRENEELRGLLNCGHTRESAYTVRVVGDDHTPKKFNVWGAKAIAGIGHLADTLMDRAVTLELRRKLPHETVERLRYAEPELFETLAAKLARFAEDFREAVRRARPDLPASLNDRAQDNWEPLLAIADVAGGSWPKLGREAALKLSGVDSPSMTIGTELLADIQDVFATKRTDRISTADLITALCSDDERPWATYNRGKPLSPRQLAKRMGEYGIQSKTVRIGYGTPKGFELAQFEESFSRYLTPTETIRHTQQSSGGTGLGVADTASVAATPSQSATLKPAWDKACCGVADKSEVRRDGTSGFEVEI